jgi:hypothetical protein
MTWANSVLPVFMAASEPKLGILAASPDEIQIGDTLRRSETIANHGLQRFIHQINRTVVV